MLPRLTTPANIQKFLDEEIGYNREPHGATCYSPQTVLRKREAHCMEGALLGAMDLEAVRDSDHVLAVYRVNGHWGAVAKSDYAGLRSREPVYATIRELAMSYFEHYYNPAGEKTLRVIVAKFGRQFEVGGEEGSAKFGDQFLHRVTFVAPPLAPEVAIKARRVFRPVRLMPISA